MIGPGSKVLFHSVDHSSTKLVSGNSSVGHVGLQDLSIVRIRHEVHSDWYKCIKLTEGKEGIRGPYILRDGHQEGK